MPGGSQLSEFEKGQIVAFQSLGKSQRAIAKELKRSRCVVQNYLAKQQRYGKKKRKGRKRKLSKRDERQIGKLASNSSSSVNVIKKDLNLEVSKTTVWRAIQRNPNIVREKMAKAPRLLAHHINARLQFARENMNREWKNVSSSRIKVKRFLMT